MKAIVVGAGGITGALLTRLSGLGEVLVADDTPVPGVARHDLGAGDRQVAVSAIVSPLAFRWLAAAGRRRIEAPGRRP